MAPEEIDSLKDLLFEFRHFSDYSARAASNSGIPSTEWTKFQMYTESPISNTELEHLENELREAVWSEEDKNFVLAALQSMVEADGNITEDEQVILNRIKDTIQAIDTGFFGDLGRLIRGALQRRSDAASKASNRENYLEDFLNNKVYYELRRRLDLGEANLEIPDEELRKLSVAGGLMARVAQVDNIVLEKESDQIMSILQNSWHLSREAAAFVIAVAMSEVARNFDYLRMTREFLELAAPGERGNLLDMLFVIANADEKISTDEFKEIHNIADYLLLSDNRVNEARSKIAG